ncbi:hypothetical protein AB0M54_46385 [Actinoplanes sp. NPDC051470]|uniref:hypothetical protein n=1 Tax=Actinoplanes sp. NPDC051470 TaxID=3157224 RepID=UPI00342D91F9
MNVRADVRPLARVCADQRGRTTDGRPRGHRFEEKGGQMITTDETNDEGRNRSIRRTKTLVIEDAQVKTSLEVPLSEAAADVLWRIIDRARKNRST